MKQNPSRTVRLQELRAAFGRLTGRPFRGDYHAEYQFIRTDIAPLLMPNTTNWLYLNVSDYGGLAALMFSATITINGVAAGAQSISPSNGGNTGSVSTLVIGSNFVVGTQIRLTGLGADILGTNTTVVTPNVLTSTFDLTNAQPGLRAVLITTPGGPSITVPSGFSIQQGGAPDVRIQKIGTPAVLGRNQTYYITISNVGIVDSAPVRIVESLEPWFTFMSAVPEPSSIRQAPDVFPRSAIGGNYNAYLEWDLPKVAAGGLLIISYTVQLDPSFSVTSPVHGPACVGAGKDICEAAEIACYSAIAATCVAQPELCPELIEAVAPCEGAYGACRLAATGLCVTFTTPVRGSVDPNDIVGPPGVGAQNWIRGDQPLQYAVFFENLPSATKSATDVTLTDTFDTSIIDTTTIRVGTVSFGNSAYTPPNVPLISGPLTSDIDLRPAQNLLVRAIAKLDATTGQVLVQLLSIDPATGQPPTNPLVGFLPPGIGGSVLFTAKPKGSIDTGTTIQNEATVVFDQNPAISTSIWSNMIDKTPPTSKVLTLPGTESTYSFPVQWVGTDAGAGVQDFTIFVSDNGGPFIAWLTNATATQGVYKGTGGHTYTFYSIARDLVGNVESGKTVGETTTQVLVDNTPPVIVPQISGTLGNNGWYISNVILTWNVNDPESGIASSTGCASTTLTADTAGVSLGCSATNGAGLSTSTGVTVKIDKTPPVILGMPAAGCSLWPPNHKLVQVATVTAADVLSGVAAGSFTVTGSSNEPSSDPKDPEIVITPNGSGGLIVQLQADRLGTGTGRTYTLIATAKDLAGNTATVTSTCTVPHDQGH